MFILEVITCMKARFFPDQEHIEVRMMTITRLWQCLCINIVSAGRCACCIVTVVQFENTQSWISFEVQSHNQSHLIFTLFAVNDFVLFTDFTHIPSICEHLLSPFKGNDTLELVLSVSCNSSVFVGISSYYSSVWRMPVIS